MTTSMNITNIPAPRVAFIDPRTGLMAREWYRFFLNLFVLTGGGTSDTSITDLAVAPQSQGIADTDPNLGYETQLAAMQAKYDDAASAIQGAYLSPAPVDLTSQFDPYSFGAPRVEVGTLASQNANNVSITGGSITGTTVTSQTLTIGTGLTGSSYNGSAPVTITIDSTVLVSGGALGTPSSGNLANCTGYSGTSALVTTGALNSGSITSGFGSIDVGADAISGGAISGTTGTFTQLLDGTKTTATQIRAYGWDAVSGAGSDRGSITLGSAGTYYGQFNYANTGSLYIDNAYNNAAATIYLRVRTLGTPVNAITLTDTAVTIPGYLQGAEQTAPAAPGANGYRLFAQDNGAGKTQLMVIFNTGAAQQIAIQP